MIINFHPWESFDNFFHSTQVMVIHILNIYYAHITVKLANFLDYHVCVHNTHADMNHASVALLYVAMCLCTYIFMSLES